MKKLAILFGNDAYDFGKAQLQCAVNDAKALEEKLVELSFETKSILNSDLGTMAAEISNYETVLSGYDVGLFFFAGHGFPFDGLNYLAATDTSFADDRSAAYTSFSLDNVIAAMDRSSVLIKILIIDACRSSSVGGNRGIGTGFAPIFAPRGTIIAFATSPGQTAKEKGEHGLFTAAILEYWRYIYEKQEGTINMNFLLGFRYRLREVCCNKLFEPQTRYGQQADPSVCFCRNCHYQS